MSVTEYQRHQIFQWFEEAMGPERAAIAMDLLPPVGWGDIATRTDLVGELALVRAELKSEVAGLKVENAAMLHRMYFTLVASQATMVGMILAVLRFF